MDSNVINSPYKAVNVPDVTITEYIFERNFDDYGSCIALIDGISGASITYRELKILVQKYTTVFREIGVKRGEVLCIFAPNHLQWEAVFLACLGAGIVVCTANPAFTINELIKQLLDCKATYLYTVSEYAEKAKQAVKTIPLFKKIITQQNEDGCLCLSDFSHNASLSTLKRPSDLDTTNDAAVIAYSSGTTGVPKGVVLTNRNIVAQTLMARSNEVVPLYGHIKDYGPLTTLALMPFYHLYGMVLMTKCLDARHKIVILPKFEPQTFFKTVQNYQCTLLPLAPPLVIFLAKSAKIYEKSLESVRFILSGAAPLDKETQDVMAKKFPQAKIVQGYGLTETTAGTHATPKNDPVVTGSIGKLLPNMEAKIMDPAKETPLPPGQRGELWVRGPTIFSGYLDQPEQTRKCLRQDGWLKTGDVVVCDENGRFFIVDRLKELIKYKGYQVAPAELEGTLINLPMVADAAVVGVADERAGEVPKAFLVLKEGVTATKEEIHTLFNAQVSDYKKLRGGIEFVNSIPKSPSGKILRRLLRNKTSKL